MIPDGVFDGTILLTVPHADDCALGCGGLLAMLPDKARIHVVYATDGAMSPVPVTIGRSTPPPELPQIRREEARAAMGYLGIAAERVHFLDLPDSRLKHNSGPLRQRLTALMMQIRPDVVLVPFRYDRHPDHIALNRVMTGLVRDGTCRARLLEYFVYHHWRLLPTGDVRAYIRPELLLTLDTSAVAAKKRAALDRFTSQTTVFYPWQTRPNLTPAMLDAVSQAPEMFLRYDPSQRGTAIFTGARRWIPVAHVLEPALKQYKDRAVALMRRGLS